MVEWFKRFVIWVISILFRYSGFDWLVRFCRAPSATILTFHRLGTYYDPLLLSVSLQRFEEIIASIETISEVTSIEHMLNNLQSQSCEHSYVLTFDDGYADNLLLKKYAEKGLPITIYVATGCLDKGIIWPQLLTQAILTSKIDFLDLTKEKGGRYDLRTEAERIQTILKINHWLKGKENSKLLDIVQQIVVMCEPEYDCKELMLTWKEVQLLHETGVVIGAHTVNHAILSQLSTADAAAEVHDSVKLVQKKLSIESPLSFAYPNGRTEDFTAAVVEQVAECGCSSAVTTIYGVNTKSTNKFVLCRIPVTQISFLSPFGSFSRSRFLSETSGGIAFLKEIIIHL